MLKESEIKYLLSRCENGTEDIISVRSKVFHSLEKGIDDFSTKELIALIQKNPSILKRPILLSENSMVIGYDDDEITTFTPRTVRSQTTHDRTPGSFKDEVDSGINQNEMPGTIHLRSF